MHLGSDRICLVLAQDVGGSECIVANRVGFFVAHNYLVGLTFGPLLPAERDALKAIPKGTHG